MSASAIADGISSSRLRSRARTRVAQQVSLADNEAAVVGAGDWQRLRFIMMAFPDIPMRRMQLCASIYTVSRIACFLYS